MSTAGIRRTVRPASAAPNAGAGPVPVGATVPNPVAGTKQWSPTVANLLVLIVLELVAFAVLRHLFRIVQR
jgi:hypothetical protein